MYVLIRRDNDLIILSIQFLDNKCIFETLSLRTLWRLKYNQHDLEELREDTVG